MDSQRIPSEPTPSNRNCELKYVSLQNLVFLTTCLPAAILLYGAIGKWLKVNGESIYETRRSPLPSTPDWGDCSVSKDGNTLYLHILTWPESGTITAKGLSGTAGSAVLLENGEAADFDQQGADLKITLPAKPLNANDTVIKGSLGK